MNDSTRHALDRVERAMDRAGRKRPRGFSTAPLALGLALILGYQLLVRLVPALWAQILPGGFDQGGRMPGVAGLVWRLAWFCHLRFPVVFAGAMIAIVLGFGLGRSPVTRPFAWLMAVAAIGVDAAILAIALKTGMDANGVGQVLA